jgi:Ca2+/H+ antiporter, TMEM165/GDT1 family
MKFTTTNSLILLLLAGAQASLALTKDEPGALAPPVEPDANAAVVNLDNRRGVPTKDAPVDGKDGKPHLGPFVETDLSSTQKTQERPQLKGRPDDPTVVDGKKIPDTNDGVMFDPNREHAQEGTTGTEGGVSEKSRARKAQEGKTGGKAVAQPEAPKEKPPVPPSEQEVVKTVSDKTVKTTVDPDEDISAYTGLDVR